MMLFGIRINGELGALPGLEDHEDDHRDERANELWQRGINVQNAEINARELACRGDCVFRTVFQTEKTR